MKHLHISFNSFCLGVNIVIFFVNQHQQSTILCFNNCLPTRGMEPRTFSHVRRNPGLTQAFSHVRRHLYYGHVFFRTVKKTKIRFVLFLTRLLV